MIIKLPNRHAFAVISNQQDSIPFKTQTVDDEYFSETHLNKLLLQQYQKSLMHKEANSVEEEILERQARLKPIPLQGLSDEDFMQ